MSETKRPTTPQSINGLRRSESGDPYEGVPDAANVLVICPRCGAREAMTVGKMKRVKACGSCRMRVDHARVFATTATELEDGVRESEKAKRAPRFFDMAGKLLDRVRDN